MQNHQTMAFLRRKKVALLASQNKNKNNSNESLLIQTQQTMFAIVASTLLLLSVPRARASFSLGDQLHHSFGNFYELPVRSSAATQRATHATGS